VGRGFRGGAFDGATPSFELSASARYGGDPTGEVDRLGFRLAMVPEPSTGLLVFAGLVGIAGWRRARA
jgi:hypothetical protein